MKGVLDIPALFKNNEKLNKKQVFSTESKKQHSNFKQKEIITYRRGFIPSSTPRCLR